MQILAKVKRILPQPSLYSVPDNYSFWSDEHAVHELDQENLIQSGRVWYGEVFDDRSLRTIFHSIFPIWIPSSGKVSARMLRPGLP